MDERVMQFRIGVMVLATLLITVIMILFFSERREFFQKKYTIYIDFPEAPGVAVNTRIRKSGIPIGAVTKVELKDEGGVRVTAEIEADRKIFDDEVPWLTRSLLTNDAVIEFRDRSRPAADPAGRPPEASPPADHAAAGAGRVTPIAEVPAASKEMPIILTAFQWTGGQATSPAAPAAAEPPAFRAPIDPAKPIPGRVEPDVMRAMAKFSDLNLQGAIDSIRNTSNHFDELIGKVNRVLGPMNEMTPQQKDQLEGLAVKAGETMDALKSMGNSVNAFAANPDLPRAVNELHTMMGAMSDTNKDMRDAIKVARSQLQDLKEFTETLRKEGPDTIAHMHQMAKGLDDMTQQLSAFSHALNDDTGSLGPLIHKRDLYDKLYSTMDNVKDLTVQLQPILHDVRVFSDKIARHPETLGVRGAISPGQGAKGLPSLSPPGGSSGDPSLAPPPDGQPWRFGR